MKAALLPIILCALSLNAQTTFNDILAKAKQGDLNSQISVADAYYHAKNFRKASDWYSKAAASGNAYAYYMLGMEYLLGQLPETRGLLRVPVPNVTHDMTLGFSNMLMSANLGYGAACGWMGWYYETGYRIGKSDVESSTNSTIQTPQQQASGGNFATGLAQGLSGRSNDTQTTMHSESSTDVLPGPDYAQAAMWYRRAADQNDAASEYSLGRFYENGLGVPKNINTALAWYTKAAQGGNANAKTRIELLTEQTGK